MGILYIQWVFCTFNRTRASRIACSPLPVAMNHLGRSCESKFMGAQTKTKKVPRKQICEGSLVPKSALDLERLAAESKHSLQRRQTVEKRTNQHVQCCPRS